MAIPALTDDFRDFLRFLNEAGVEYLLVGGYAVNYYGYHRGTIDLDVWVAATAENASNVIDALERFGYSSPELTEALLVKPDQIIRMGVPPFRVEVLTTVS